MSPYLWPSVASDLFQTKLAGEVHIFEGVSLGVLLEVRTGGMASLGVFVVQHRVALFPHSGDHFSRMPGVDAIVLG